MNKLGGYMGKVLLVDLTTNSINDYPWSDNDREMYLGGKIMAAKILYDNIKTPIDAFSPDNLLCITTSPLNGSGTPSSNRFNISTISPLTGLLTSSNCGGSFGLHLKKAGYDGLIIKGKSKTPVWIEIKEDFVKIHDATELWGKSTSSTQAVLPKFKGKIVIGPAGENKVRYASIFSQERVAGRGGVGAVMGSKNLKAITAEGNKKTPIANKQDAIKLNKKFVKLLKNHSITGKELPELGTANLIRKMQANKQLATRNYRYGRFNDYHLVSGEYMKENFLIRNTGCIGCPIKCSRVVEFNGKHVRGPELETLGLLGPNLKNNNLELIIRWNYILDELGMDTISTGGVIGFAMELSENGLWDCDLKFGEVENIEELLYDIAYRKGIGDLLAEGVKRLSEIMGGENYAIHSKGLELAAYEPRGAVGQGLGYAVSNRGGCHINGGYLIFLEGLGLGMDPYTTKAKAEFTMLQQDLLEAVSAGGTCIFTTYATMPSSLINECGSVLSDFTGKVIKHSGFSAAIINSSIIDNMPIHIPTLPHTKVLTAVTGINITFPILKKIGERGYNIERLFNIRMGLTKNDDRLPHRLVKECQVPADKRSRVPLDVLKKEYYRKRGWDENGKPTEKLLNYLGLN
ncbi:Tungsten-containing aldehyde:ferredoxin oxidoreductase [Candidatus Syntrophocurvum alkaliphilum]|uniref:Tungsten-containing aldehyde:ferredoxin oxidoreductase n=1 Tax=Candidatus Syntrophocurvum alkaliphilum TaxID=2293317 RepID=A0A6I6DBV0_9FIRM|nr:aldehyde ferredoxin oxidoreductase family protein [Candidatus Syntrophocurvum alkaliphilum]QGU00096.1 Tungsten-containing aldehyde:ferredoxin oxidoreductase [Candidatus Syntrophocurvum alkaliphilum]